MAKFKWGNNMPAHWVVYDWETSNDKLGHYTSSTGAHSGRPWLQQGDLGQDLQWSHSDRIWRQAGGRFVTGIILVDYWIMNTAAVLMLLTLRDLVTMQN